MLRIAANEQGRLILGLLAGCAAGADVGCLHHPAARPWTRRGRRPPSVDHGGRHRRQLAGQVVVNVRHTVAAQRDNQVGRAAAQFCP